MSHKEALEALESVLTSLRGEYQQGTIGREMIEDGFKALAVLKRRKRKK